ncbi:MAG: hypothetical protein KC561_04575 [Myxococcales bacterium]|nr:hypothetical protein [Myxococcales bacterium]
MTADNDGSSDNQPETLDLLSLGPSDFEAWIDTSWSCQLPDGSTTLLLKRVERLGGTQGEGGRPYAVLFEGSPDLPLTQGTYRLENPQNGALFIFLVPLAPSRSAPTYEAVFN